MYIWIIMHVSRMAIEGNACYQNLSLVSKFSLSLVWGWID